MKKILITLSFFLLTNVSLANSFEQIGNSSGVNFAIVFIILFLLIFIIGITFVIKNCKLLLTSDKEAEKRKIAVKSLMHFIISFVFLEIGKIFLTIFFYTGTGIQRNPNYIDFTFNFMWCIVSISMVVWDIIIELIKRKKINNDKLIYLVSTISIILISTLAIILIFGLSRGDYYNTTYYIWGS